MKDVKEQSAVSATADDMVHLLNDTVSEHSEFLDLAKQGKNQWWRYLGGTLFIVILPFAVTGIIFSIMAPQIYVDPAGGLFTGISSLRNYVFFNTVHVSALVSVFFAARFIHKRRCLSLITPNQSVDWKKLGKSFAVFLIITAISAIVRYLLIPSDIELNFNPDRFFFFAALALFFEPIRAAGDELFFRGYLLQMIGLFTRKSWLLIIISGLLYLLTRLANPELSEAFLPKSLLVFIIGCFLTMITLKANGLEMSLGIQSAMNLFSALIICYAGSMLKTESIFSYTEMHPVLSLLSFCVSAAVFYFIMFRGKTSRQLG